MTAESSPKPSEWGALVDASEEARHAKIRETYGGLLQLPEKERVSRMVELVQAEYQLPDDRLRVFTRTRLMVWLGMEKEAAEAIADTYDKAMRQVPATAAMRRVAMVQAVGRELPFDQLERLYELIPSILKEMPLRVVPGVVGAASKPTVAEVRKARKPWWKIW